MAVLLCSYNAFGVRLLFKALLSRLINLLLRCHSTVLEIQRLRGNDVTSHLTQGRLELLLEFLAAHDLGRLRDLTQQLFQAAEETDQAAFVDVGHFAKKVTLVSDLLSSRGLSGKLTR
jgi:hypothetical protein